MSQKVAKSLFQELVKHHSFASAVQAKAVAKTELARQMMAKRAGSTTPDEIVEYKAKPLDPNVVDKFNLSQLEEKDVSEIVDYLRHQRKYKELLDKYSSGPEDTIERVNATARRVGLDATKL